MSRIIPSEEINHRIDFPLLCNARGLKHAFEIGTDQGIFAAQFMSRFQGDWLFCVDSYDPYEIGGAIDRLPDMLMATMQLMPYAGRARIIRGASLEVAKGLPEWIRRFLSFVYLDDDHSRRAVTAGMRVWWELLPAHGILAGHDFDATHPGVMEAVTEFADRHQVVVRLTAGDAEPSWYIYKTEPQELVHQFFKSGTSPNPFFVAK